MAQSYFPLHRPEIASSLAAGDRKLLSRFTGSLAIKANQTIVPAGEEHKRIYRLNSGWCARLRYLSDGRVQVSALLLPGDLFCVRALFLKAQPDEIAAVTDCTLSATDEPELRAAAMADADLMLRLTWQLAEDERRLQNWMMALSRASAEQRMALLFLDIRARMVLAGIIEPSCREITWPLTQQAMGDVLGITSVHVNRTLKLLRAAGLAHIRHKTAVLDPEGLHDLAYPLLDIYERGRSEFGARLSAAHRPERTRTIELR